MKLAEMLRDWRIMERIPLRTLAQEIGITLATLSRIERGHPCDGKSLSKILRWMLQ